MGGKEQRENESGFPAFNIIIKVFHTDQVCYAGYPERYMEGVACI